MQTTCFLLINLQTPSIEQEVRNCEEGSSCMSISIQNKKLPMKALLICQDGLTTNKAK